MMISNNKKVQHYPNTNGIMVTRITLNLCNKHTAYYKPKICILKHWYIVNRKIKTEFEQQFFLWDIWSNNRQKCLMRVYYPCARGFPESGLTRIRHLMVYTVHTNVLFTIYFKTDLMKATVFPVNVWEIWFISQ